MSVEKLIVDSYGNLVTSALQTPFPSRRRGSSGKIDLYGQLRNYVSLSSGTGCAR